MKTYSALIEEARQQLQEAEALVIGVGSGLSAAGGLCYSDPVLLQRWFPEYAALGFQNMAEVQSAFWWLHQCRPEQYWAYWARHIYHLRYEAPVAEPYHHLRRLLEGRDYFIISTNADGQLERSGLDLERIFAPQGNYAYFQCSKPCTQEIYDNQAQIERMIAKMPTALEIRTEDVPHCPRCGALLTPNLRCDDTFVEAPHLRMQPAYQQFLQQARSKRTVFLELGVGYNTPGVIRYPFNDFCAQFPQSHLIRVNRDCVRVPAAIAARSTGIQADLAQVLANLL